MPDTPIRKYPAMAPGPYTVFIREKKVPLQPLKFSVHLHRSYPSIKTFFKVAPGKMKAVFGNKNEANVLPVDSFFKDYHVYIPAKDVESVGVIDFPVGEEADKLVLKGKGTFRNSFQVCTITSVHRITGALVNQPLHQKMVQWTPIPLRKLRNQIIVLKHVMFGYIFPEQYFQIMSLLKACG